MGVCVSLRVICQYVNKKYTLTYARATAHTQTHKHLITHKLRHTHTQITPTFRTKNNCFNRFFKKDLYSFRRLLIAWNPGSQTVPCNIYICISLSLSLSLYIFTHTHTHIYIYFSLHPLPLSLSLSLYIYIYIYIVYIYIYTIYIYIYTHICVYVFIHTHIHEKKITLTNQWAIWTVTVIVKCIPPKPMIEGPNEKVYLQGTSLELEKVS